MDGVELSVRLGRYGRGPVWCAFASCAAALMLVACGGGGGGGGGAGAFLPTSTTGTTTAATGSTTTTPTATDDKNPEVPVQPDPDPEPQPQPELPVARVPSNIDMLTKRTIGIDASKSTGINGAAVSYLWNLVSKPSGSTTQIFDPTPPMTTLWADIPGTYTLKLVVSSGGKTSAPAYVVVKAVAPGALPAFATFNASGFKISDSAVLSGCAYYRRVANYGNFWDFISNPYDFSCLFQSSADAERQGGFSGGQLSGFAQNFSLLQGSGISGTSQITRADVNTVSGYEFKTSAEIIELSKVPAGKATGTVLAHQVAVANPAPYTSGTLQYKIGGSFVPTNVPAGWEMAQEMTVKVVLSGTTFDNNQAVLESFTIFEKTFTSDFSETIPLEMTWSQLPASFTGNFASYGAVVVHRMTLKRANE